MNACIQLYRENRKNSYSKQKKIKDYINKMEEMFAKIKLKIKKKDPNKILQCKIENIMKEGKWQNNKALNIPGAFGRYKDHKDPPSI